VQIYTQEKLKNKTRMREKPIVFKFWASWCGPCRMLSPIFKKISEEEKNIERFTFREINSDEDENEELVMNFNVRNLPTIIIYDRTNNKIIDRRSALMKQEDLQKWLDDGYAKYEEMIQES